MDQQLMMENLSALAQESRRAIFRLLVQKQPHGLPVGEISRLLDIIPSAFSGHLGILKRAGLLKATRQQREIHYAANLEHMGDFIRFRLKDCCNGQVENCGDIIPLTKV